MADDLVAGIDTSTQSCTIVVRSLHDGHIVAQARAPHPVTAPPCSEQAPEAWWQALLKAFGDLECDLSQISAISVGGQGHGLVILDENGQAIRDAKLWNDTQSEPQAKQLRELLVAKEWAHRTGSVPGPALTISKLAWIQQYEPNIIDRIRHILLPSDYLLYRLNGQFNTERGVASGTGYFNPFLNVWDFELGRLAVPNLDWENVLPNIIDSSAVSGQVIANGLLAGLNGAITGAGSGDNMTAALGMGLATGETIISFGTSGTLYGLTNTPIQDESGIINGYADATGMFLPMITTLNSAKVSDAFRRILNIDTKTFDEIALKMEAGSGGVVLVPYLDGERTPNLPNTTGSLFGLRSNMTAGQIARATIEGIICGLLEGGDYLTQHGVQGNDRLIVTGGASQSQAYRQILADITGKQVWICHIAEAAAAGAAVQAAAALQGKNNKQMAEEWRPIYSVVAEPNEKAWARAQDVREQYRDTLANHY